MLKKWIFLQLICMFFLTACFNQNKIGEQFVGEINSLDGVTMTVVEETASPEGISIEVMNTTVKEIGSGNSSDYNLQVESDGKWYWLKENRSFGVTAEIYFYNKDKSVIYDLNWKDRYGSLPNGRYRIVKDFSEYHSKAGYSTFFQLAAEFNLK